MTTRFDTLIRPAPGSDFRPVSGHRKVGYGLALIGLMVLAVTLIANIVAANDSDPISALETLAWSFGLTTVGLGTIKLAISVVLIGILIRLWLRVDAVKESLPGLKAETRSLDPRGDIDTASGKATETADVPGQLPVHRMAKTMWFPMIVMGYMAVIVGFIVSLVWSGSVADGTQQAAQAWTAGVQFLGEGLLLAGISFLLGSILASLRSGGGEIQKSLDVPVQTLKMPLTAKLFVGFMALGLMLSILQFVLYIVAAGVGSAQSFASWIAWLGPLREFALGSLLAGIVLALVTIGNVLRFQFDMVTDFVRTGR